MSFEPTKPHNDLPPLPPLQDLESKAVLKKCITARDALARLYEAGWQIPNQAVLINTFSLLEARASSEIENIVTTADRLFQYTELGERADPATKEALRYRTALYRGLKLVRETGLGTRTAVAVCRTIKDVELDIRAVPGTALQNQQTGAVIYTPPDGVERLRDLLGNWERFLHENDEIDPLVRLAAGHYQFEAIHPFTDGNGRTGRILNLLFLCEQGLLDIPILYLSRHILKSKEDYYALLDGVTRNEAWEDWILYMLDAVEKTAIWTREKIAAIRRLMDETQHFVRQAAPGIYSHELIELSFTQPYCRIGNVVEAGLAKRQTASVYLKKLCEIGVLRSIKVGREKLFVHPKFVRLLTSEEHEFEPYGLAAQASGE
jgi:Fic family protein